MQTSSQLAAAAPLKIRFTEDQKTALGAAWGDIGVVNGRDFSIAFRAPRMPTSSVLILPNASRANEYEDFLKAADNPAKETQAAAQLGTVCTVGVVYEGRAVLAFDDEDKERAREIRLTVNKIRARYPGILDGNATAAVILRLLNDKLEVGNGGATHFDELTEAALLEAWPDARIVSGETCALAFRPPSEAEFMRFKSEKNNAARKRHAQRTLALTCLVGVVDRGAITIAADRADVAQVRNAAEALRARRLGVLDGSAVGEVMADFLTGEAEAEGEG